LRGQLRFHPAFFLTPPVEFACQFGEAVGLRLAGEIATFHEGE